MSATLLELFPSTAGEGGGGILVLGGRNVKHLVVTWVGFCVGRKGGYRAVRRCHDSSRKNMVRRNRDVVVIGGQGLDFPADLRAPWLPPYGPFFFYPEICPCLQPAGILTLEHRILSDVGNERIGLWVTVTKGFQQPSSCRKYTARSSCTVLSGPVPLPSRHLQLAFVLPSRSYKICLRILFQTCVNVGAITLRFAVLGRAPTTHPNTPLLFVSAWLLPYSVMSPFCVHGLRRKSLKLPPIKLGLPVTCQFTHSFHDSAVYKTHCW